MTCWHCSGELETNFQAEDLLKHYHCPACDCWYEMRKDKEKVNGAVPVRFYEISDYPLTAQAV